MIRLFLLKSKFTLYAAFIEISDGDLSHI